MGGTSSSAVGWRDFPDSVRRHIGINECTTVDIAEIHARQDRLWKRKEAAARASIHPNGWLWFARDYFRIVVDTEPEQVVKSLVMGIWTHYKATGRDPWLPRYVDTGEPMYLEMNYFRDLGRAYYNDGQYRRIIQFNNEIYRSDPQASDGSTAFDAAYYAYEGYPTERYIEDGPST